MGHIWIALWVSGSSGSTSVTHSQPCIISILLVSRPYVQQKPRQVRGEVIIDYSIIPILCLYKVR